MQSMLFEARLYMTQSMGSLRILIFGILSNWHFWPKFNATHMIIHPINISNHIVHCLIASIAWHSQSLPQFSSTIWEYFEQMLRKLAIAIRNILFLALAFSTLETLEENAQKLWFSATNWFHQKRNPEKYWSHVPCLRKCFMDIVCIFEVISKPYQFDTLLDFGA